MFSSTPSSTVLPDAPPTLFSMVSRIGRLRYISYTAAGFALSIAFGVAAVVVIAVVQPQPRSGDDGRIGHLDIR